MHSYKIVYQLIDEFGEGVLLDVVTPVQDFSATTEDFLDERHAKFLKNVKNVIENQNETY